MKNSVTLLYWEDLCASELNIVKIVEFFGGTVQTIRFSAETAHHSDGNLNPFGSSQCLILNARTLANIQKVIQGNLLNRLAELAPKVFVYGFETGNDDMVRSLTAGSLASVSAAAAAEWIHITSDDFCRQLSGLRFESTDGDVAGVFVEGGRREFCKPLMSLGQQPFCVRIKHEGIEGVFTTATHIADLDAVLKPGATILDSFVGLAPLMMFLFAYLRDYLWQNDSPAACFIVDDPLLRKRYGWLDYRKLAALIDRKGFSTSIAFIPWNYKRSRRRIADLFRGRKISLCVHGCDHTWGEFGGNDTVALTQKGRQALERMKLHHKLFGLGFDDVMVFPQGIFSKAAMGALKSCGYLAVTNSTPFPIDADHQLTVRDLLQGAVTRYSNMPLFKRWYPHQFPELAFSVFLGKPALLVEHHDFFRGGFGELVETIEKLERIEPRLHWTSPADVCARTSWKKLSDNGDVQVLFFTDRFEIRNENSRTQRYVLTRAGQHGSGATVTINGRRVDVMHNSDDITMKLVLGAGEKAEIKIENPETMTMVPRAQSGLKYEASVFLRRWLTEFRDNYLERTPFTRNSSTARGSHL